MSVMPPGSSAFLESSDLYEPNWRFKLQTDENLSLLNLLLLNSMNSFGALH